MVYSFSGADGRLPYTALTEGKAGMLYGTTIEGGTFGKYGSGTVFSLTPPAGGQTAWTEQVLHSFDDRDDGNSPAKLMLDKIGTLYGVTQYGAGHNTGTVFQILP